MKIMSYHCQIIRRVGAYLRSDLQQTSVFTNTFRLREARVLATTELRFKMM